MAAKKLTKRSVEGAAPGLHFDVSVKGFGVRVGAGGRRVYVVAYRPAPGGRRSPKKRFVIGPHGAPWTVEAARLEAKRILGLVAAGKDPAAMRGAARGAPTVAEVCRDYLKRARAGEILTRFGRAKRSSTLDIDRGRIERHIVPLIGTKRVADLTPADVQRLLGSVIRGATGGQFKTKKRGLARVKGGPGAASRVVQLLGAVLQMAKRDGLIAINPVHGVRLPKPNERHRHLSEDEYKALGTALDAAGPTTAATVARLLALTGLRRGEALSLQWSAVDHVKQVLTLEETKTGRSIRPVGRAALDVLASVPHHAGAAGKWVFPSERQGSDHFVSLRESFATICAAAGLQNVTPHSLRHSYATVAGEVGLSELAIKMLLGHVARGVTQRYVGVVDHVLVAAADRVASEVARRLGISGGEPVVVEFPSGTARP